jgi:hypothetical protein
MSLVLATQAKSSSFYPFRSYDENRDADRQLRENVEALGKAVRWRMNAMKRKGDDEATSQNTSSVIDEFGIPKDGNAAAPKRHSLHRGPSLSQSGRFRRRGWRASTNMSQVYGEEPTTMGISRQNSEFGYLSQTTQEWASSVREEDEDEEDRDTTPGQSFAPGTGPPGRQGQGQDASYATSGMISETPTTYGGISAMTASTMRGNSNLVGGGGMGDWEYNQQTPQAAITGYGRRRREMSTDSAATETDQTTPTAAPDIRRRDTGRL